MIRLEGVAARRGRRTVLRDISLEVRPGEVVAVLGPNGAGKSTLLDVLSGALPVASGTVTGDARVAAALQGGELARRTAQDNVELGLAWWGVPRDERPERARAALAALKADHLADQPVTQLSGGERRRVHLARAMAVRPDLLLLDEPFAGLDPVTRADLLSDAAGAVTASASATVVVVHDRTEAWALATRLVVLLDGRVAADGPPRELLETPPSAEVARFLGYTGELQVDGGLLMTRPVHARLGTGRPATVEGRLPQENGVLLDLRTDQGRLQALAPHPGPGLGDEVLVDVVGGFKAAPAPR